MTPPEPHLTALWLNRDAAVTVGGSEPAAPHPLLLPLDPWLPDRPVPFTLTSQAEAVLDASHPEPEPDAEADAEAEAEWADNWDSADSHAYMDRVEAGLEPEAGL